MKSEQYFTPTLVLTPLQSHFLGLGFAHQGWGRTGPGGNSRRRDSGDIRGLPGTQVIAEHNHRAFGSNMSRNGFQKHLSPPAAHLALPSFTGTGHSESVGGARPEVVTDVLPLGSAVNGLPPPS